MKLLALETATEACSIALWLDGDVLERHELAPRRHAELALAWVDELLSEAGLARSQLDAVACSRGPGAFTGVRLAVALTQGLALGLNRPVLGVSTLEALAVPAMRAINVGDSAVETILAAIDARMGEVYLAEYRRVAGCEWRREGDEIVIAPERVALVPERPRLGIGTGFAAMSGALATRLAAGLRRVDADALPHAGDVAQLAVSAWTRGEALAPEHLQPAYLRNKVALTLAEQGKPVPQEP